MKFDSSRHVHIDWKVGGDDWLVLLRDEFPEITQLQGDAFEALLDELAHEEVEVCLQALANHLHAYGYEVWNLDVGADDYRIALVPSGKRAAFEQYWKTHQPRDFEGGDAVEIELRRTEPNEFAEQERIDQAAEAQGKPHGAKRKKKLDWLAEKKGFSAFQVDRFDVCDGRVLASRAGEPGEGGRVSEWWFWRMDLRQWPPTFELVQKIGQDDSMRLFPSLAAAVGEATLWQWRNLGEDDRSEQLRIRRDGEWASFGPPEARHPSSSGSEESDLWHDGWFWRVRCIGIDEARGWQISRTSATTTEVVYEGPEKPGHLHAFGTGRVLLMGESSYRIWEAGRMGEARPLPVSTRAPNAVVWLGGNEILYFDHFVRDVVPPWWRDQVLRAWRFDVVTGTARCADMEGFGVQYNAHPLEIDGTVRKRKSMSAQESGVHVERGHGDWWIINYNENVLGVRTIAWFWNAATDEVIKINSQDIPRLEPCIVYVPAMDRYLGLGLDGLIRLPEFETIRAANGGACLTWNEAAGEIVT